MKILVLLVLCAAAAITTAAAAAPEASAGELAACYDALNSTKSIYLNRYWQTAVPVMNDINVAFHRTLEKAIEEDDVVNTEAIFKNCAKHIETVEHLGGTYKPDDWVINFAAEHGAEKIVEMLLDNQLVDVNALDALNYNVTPIHFAARGSGSLDPGVNPRNQLYVNIARVLIENGANVNAESYFGSPLQEAAKTGGIEVAKMLIAKGANVNSKGKNDFTALHMSGEFNKANMTRLLIENGAEIDAKNKAGLTPFLFSAACGCKDVAKVLIDAKADKNALDNNGNTALHLIAKYRKANKAFYADVVQFLIENNVDRTIRNNDGDTACDIAKETGKTLLIPVLGCDA